MLQKIIMICKIIHMISMIGSIPTLIRVELLIVGFWTSLIKRFSHRWIDINFGPQVAASNSLEFSKTVNLKRPSQIFHTLVPKVIRERWKNKTIITKWTIIRGHKGPLIGLAREILKIKNNHLKILKGQKGPKIGVLGSKLTIVRFLSMKMFKKLFWVLPNQ
jgi:hypothetical protein